MIAIYIIIGYLISVGVSIISDILIILLIDDVDRKKELKNAETIGDFFCVLRAYHWFPIVNVVVCFGNIFLGSLMLLYELCRLIKLNILWNKFLNIKIRKKR
jgi:hypothetical protein